MARPRKQQPESRSERLNLRLLPDERATIEARAAASGLTPTDYARRRALGGKLAAAPRRADPALVLAVNRAGVNLNQIARALNSGLGHSPHELSETLARLNQLLDRLQDVE
ncbi:mobilisation protein (MobC) [Nitrosospira multiformis ATCC 25196]|uniref:Mobilisation protein (MobC) n=1 Tax=Nitrosospira multiformis (strain ATCC 25196 / NCIMB 11849 / C 71) TaxID=323848 RepID=Q2Y576_NITMU|nr:plasmid mobilization relaxosome protein MobC [Nitrosospira multiformis]ABB76095.1 mobilization protein [Nitrosospira multiformis ATCC 25196]SEG16612.1 mobilisation protein (MobC) [Nitrosospira multiformis ATCC 25196]